MGSNNKNIGENDIDVLERYITYLIEDKLKIENNSIANIPQLLKQYSRTIWGSNGQCTKKYCKKIDKIESITPEIVTNNILTGQMRTISSIPTKNNEYCMLIDEMVESIKRRIARLKSKNLKNKIIHLL